LWIKGATGCLLTLKRYAVILVVMRLKDALSYFGTQQKLANALGISQGSISSWKQDQIPMARALQIERLTAGQLKADLSLYTKQQPSQ
jgi:hypothetical protein